MGAFGELLKVYWGHNPAPQVPVKPKKKTKLELKYEEDRNDFESGWLGLKERKEIVKLLGKYHKPASYNKFMYYCDWLEFTENGKYHYWEKINIIAKNI